MKMNARISLPGRVSKRQHELTKELVREQFRSEAQDHTRRLMKIMCIALNESEGFGKVRLGRVLDSIIKISDEHMDDEIFWTHADKRLEQIGLPFSHEDYDLMDR